MTIKEYLIEYEIINNNGKSIELRDIFNDGSVYCSGYEQLMKELSATGLSHVANARFVYRETDNEKDCIIIYYIKNIELYSKSVLEQVAKGIEKSVCTAEQKIAYNYTFQWYDIGKKFLNDENTTEANKNESMHYIEDCVIKSIKNQKMILK